jgi:hypothetical protein
MHGATHTPDSAVSQTFDLSELAIRADRARRVRVWMTEMIRAVGAFFAAVALYFFLDPPAGSIPQFSIGPLTLLGVGVSVAGFATWTRASLGRSPRRLVVSSKSVTFEDVPGRRPIEAAWSQPSFSLDLYDMREIRKADPASQSRGYDFLARLKGSPEAAIPLEAFDTIIRMSEQKGLSVKRRPVQIGARAPMFVTSVRAR